MSAQTEPSPNAYFPGGYPVDAAGNPDYVCSPHSTIIASVIIVVVLNIITITAFVVFYRYKRKEWVKRSMTSEVGRLRPVSSRVHPATAPPPPLPSRPSTASGALGPSPPIYNSSNSEVTYKDPYHPASRQRFGSLNASSASMTSLPKPWSLWCNEQPQIRGCWTWPLFLSSFNLSSPIQIVITYQSAPRPPTEIIKRFICLKVLFRY